MRRSSACCRPPAPRPSRSRAPRPSGCASGPAARMLFPPPAASRPTTTAWMAPFRASTLGTMLEAIEQMETRLRPAVHERVPRGRRQPASADPVRCQRARRMGARRSLRRRHPGAVRAARRHHHRGARRGLEKLNSMCVQFSAAERAAFFAVKQHSTRQALLNPGKLIPTLARCAEYGRMHVRRRRSCRIRNCRASDPYMATQAHRSLTSCASGSALRHARARRCGCGVRAPRTSTARRSRGEHRLICAASAASSTTSPPSSSSLRAAARRFRRSRRPLPPSASSSHSSRRHSAATRPSAA